MKITDGTVQLFCVDVDRPFCADFVLVVLKAMCKFYCHRKAECDRKDRNCNNTNYFIF